MPCDTREPTKEMKMDAINRAIEFAALAHRHQVRKGTALPYVSHPYAVGMMLARLGCAEEVVVAGLLHDTVEDTQTTLAELQSLFGEQVARIVQGCTEPDKSLSWETRKTHTIAFLATADEAVRLVALADKLHNVLSMQTARAQVGDKVWERFKRGRDQQSWYYHALLETLGPQVTGCAEQALHGMLSEAVAELFGH
jgi:(p)ppGpp synthase/HD superfamily hydrolase